jgi:hypothetical protein
MYIIPGRFLRSDNEQLRTLRCGFCTQHQHGSSMGMMPERGGGTGGGKANRTIS